MQSEDKVAAKRQTKEKLKLSVNLLLNKMSRDIKLTQDLRVNNIP